MKKAASVLFASLLFSTPLFYHPSLLFPDQAKRAWIALLLPLPLFLGPILDGLRGRGFRLPEPKFPLLGLLTLACLSAIWAPSFWLWAAATASLALGLGVAAFASWSVGSPESETSENWPWLVLPALVAGGIAASIGLLQSTGLDLMAHPFETRNAPVSTFGNTNHAAEFLAPLAAIAFLLAAAERGIRGHLGMVSLFLLIAYLSVSGVRAGVVATSAGLLLASWLLWRSFSPKQRALLIAPWIAASLGWFAPKLILPPPGTEASPTRSIDTIEVRKKVYASTVKMIAEHPMLGVGQGNFQAIFPLYRDPEEIEISSHGRRDPAESAVEEPHNDYLLFSSELGLLGVLFVGWLGWSVVRRGKEASRDLGLALAFTGIAVMGVNALFRSPWTNPSSALLFWTLLGLFFAARKNPSFPAQGKGAAVLAAFLFAFLGYAGFRGLAAETLLATAIHQEPEHANAIPRDRTMAAAAAQTPWDLKKWEILGIEQRVAAQWQEAKESYGRLLAIHPHHFNGRLQRGLVHLDLDEFSSARADFAWAARLDPNNPRLARAQALLAHREGDDLEAISKLRESIERGGDVHALKRFGVQVEKAGNASRAMRFYQAHLEIHPEDADTWIAMGQIFRNQGDDREARRDFAQGHRLYGIEHLRAGKPADAERQFRLFRRFAQESDPLPDLYLAAAALAQGHREEAKALLDEAKTRGAIEELLFHPGLEALSKD